MITWSSADAIAISPRKRKRGPEERRRRSENRELKLFIGGRGGFQLIARFFERVAGFIAGVLKRVLGFFASVFQAVFGLFAVAIKTLTRGLIFFASRESSK